MAALFLPGFPRVASVPRRRAPLVESVLRRFAPASSEVGDCLREHGLWHEAQVLESPGLVDLALRAIEDGAVLSCVCPGYPSRWRRVLGDAAPPALWRLGSVPEGPCFSIVGSRRVSSEVRSFVRSAGAAVAASKGVLVSGGAAGCDAEAAKGASAGPVLEILPYGFGAGRVQMREGRCYLSAAPWDAGFSAALAMERNALIYAFSERSLVGACRFREGGTWNGAVQAMRRGLSQFFVRESSEKGNQALINLGACSVSDPSDFVSRDDFARPSLFAV